MKCFDYYDAHSIDDACKQLRGNSGRSILMAGGTDLITVLKEDILLNYPQTVINLKTAEDLRYICEDETYVYIGAMTTLSDLVDSALINHYFPCLQQAANRVGSPQIRNVGTVGGNLCQDTRCWYYRYPQRLGGRIICPRKGGGYCHAVKGDNRYHAVIGAHKCFAVCPSDLAVALAALEATLRLVSTDGERQIAIDDFYHCLGNSLHGDEIVKEILVPKKYALYGQCFIKYALRNSIDFAVVSACSVIRIEHSLCTDARIYLGAVAAGPFREMAVEKSILGTNLNDSMKEAISTYCLKDAKPLRQNHYKVALGRELVMETLTKALQAAEGSII